MNYKYRSTLLSLSTHDPSTLDTSNLHAVPDNTLSGDFLLCQIFLRVFFGEQYVTKR